MDNIDVEPSFCDCCGEQIKPSATGKEWAYQHDVWLFETATNVYDGQVDTGRDVEPVISFDEDYITVCTDPKCAMELRSAWRTFVQTIKHRNI